MSKGIIDLLEKRNRHGLDCKARATGEADDCICGYAQALLLLKQQSTAGEPKCKTCGLTPTERDFYKDFRPKDACPDCQQLTAGEFTKLARKAVVCLSLAESDEKGNIKDEKGVESSIETLFRACDRLDTAEAEREQLAETILRIDKYCRTNDIDIQQAMKG